jgi:hypothetical protein
MGGWGAVVVVVEEREYVYPKGCKSSRLHAAKNVQSREGRDIKVESRKKVNGSGAWGCLSQKEASTGA